MANSSTLSNTMPHDDEGTPFEEYWDEAEWKKKEATLHKRGGEYYLHVAVEKDVEPVTDEQPENGVVLGVDLNVDGYLAVPALEHSLETRTNSIPELPNLPEELHGELAVAGYVMGVDSGENLKKELEAFADFGDPHVAAVYPADYTELYEPFKVPAGQRHHWESFYLDELDEAFIETFLDEAIPKPTPQSNIAIYGLGGAINRVAAGATAYPHRDAPFAVHIQGHWVDESDDDACTEWTRDLHEQLREFGTGGEYVNNQTDTNEDRVRASFGENYDRIADMKAKWDPDDRLRSTQHVDPASETGD